MRTGTNKIVRMGLVPRRAWGVQSPGHTAPAQTVASAAGKRLPVSLSPLLGDQESGSRARAGMCGYVFLGASSLDGKMGGRRERSMAKAGVGSNLVRGPAGAVFL